MQKLAKMLGYVLGRRPDEFGLVPDEQGFVRLKDLLRALSEEPGWKHVRPATINELLLTLPAAPVEVTDSRIRARMRQHLPALQPAERGLPKLLYTCVRVRAHAVALQKGIRPGVYPHVILADTAEMALRMGKRTGPDPVLLTVRTAACRSRGVVFYRSGETLYTAAAIPAECFHGPPLPKEKAPARPAAPAAAQPKEPGSFYLDWTRSGKKHAGGHGQQPGNNLPDRRDGKKRRKPKRRRPPWRS